MKHEDFISDRIGSIINVIKENVNSYENSTYVNEELNKIEDISEIDSIINKRNDGLRKVEYSSNLIFKILNINSYDILLGYLNEEIIENIKNIEGIADCVKNIEMRESLIEPSDFDIKTLDNNFDVTYYESEDVDDKYYDKEVIKSETNWKDLYIQLDSFNHLSLISQYKYDQEKIQLYDSNYYSPSSLGEGVDIFIIDSGINTFHLDFLNSDKILSGNHRTVTCDLLVNNGKLEIIDKDDERSKLCSLEKFGKMPFHGSRVASVAAGQYFGVAKKANIHMLATDMSVSSICQALNYVKTLYQSENRIKPHKTLINMSLGAYDANNDHNILEDTINELVNLGFMFIASAGNNNVNGCEINHDDFDSQGYHIPSFYNNVISVGSIGERDALMDDYLNEIPNKIYTISNFSNYGNCTDIFAPGYIYSVHFKEYYIENVDKTQHSNLFKYAEGTSYSAPIVTGIAALIISENPDITFNQNILKEYLINMSQKDILVDNLYYDNKRLKSSPNLFANNGKKVVYSRNDQYNENLCGIFSGNNRCPPINSDTKLNCCSSNGICGTSSKYCLIKRGCQPQYGSCADDDNPTTTSNINSIATTPTTTTTNNIKSITTPDSNINPTPLSPSFSYITSDHKLGWIYSANITNENNDYLCIHSQNSIYSRLILKECDNSDYNKWYVPLTKPGYYVNSYNNTLCLELDPIGKHTRINLCSDSKIIEPFIETNIIQNDNYCIGLINSRNLIGSQCIENLSSDKYWKFSSKYKNIGMDNSTNNLFENEENNSNIEDDQDPVPIDGNYRARDAISSWIYNPKLNLCINWNGNPSISIPKLNECTFSDYNKWYISKYPKKKSYYVNSMDNSYCIFVNESGLTTIKKCNIGAAIIIYEENAIKYKNSDITKCLGITNYNSTIDYTNENNIEVSMKLCDDNSDDQYWIITTSFPKGN